MPFLVSAIKDFPLFGRTVFPCVLAFSTQTKLEFPRQHGSSLADWPVGGNLIYELPASDSRAWPLGGAVESTF